MYVTKHGGWWQFYDMLASIVDRKFSQNITRKFKIRIWVHTFLDFAKTNSSTPSISLLGNWRSKLGSDWIHGARALMAPKLFFRVHVGTYFPMNCWTDSLGAKFGRSSDKFKRFGTFSTASSSVSKPHGWVSLISFVVRHFFRRVLLWRNGSCTSPSVTISSRW